jgi:hypothetical protein
MSRRSIDSLARCITEDTNGVTEEYAKMFHNKGRFYLVDPNDGSYWNGCGWSLDYKRINESEIANLGHAQLMSEEIGGVILDQHEVQEGLKNIPGNLARIARRKLTGLVQLPAQDDSRFTHRWLEFMTLLDEWAEKRGSTRAEAWDALVKKVVDANGMDITAMAQKKALGERGETVGATKLLRRPGAV